MWFTYVIFNTYSAKERACFLTNHLSEFFAVWQKDTVITSALSIKFLLYIASSAKSFIHLFQYQLSFLFRCCYSFYKFLAVMSKKTFPFFPSIFKNNKSLVKSYKFLEGRYAK